MATDYEKQMEEVRIKWANMPTRDNNIQRTKKFQPIPGISKILCPDGKRIPREVYIQRLKAYTGFYNCSNLSFCMKDLQSRLLKLKRMRGIIKPL